MECVITVEYRLESLDDAVKVSCALLEGCTGLHLVCMWFLVEQRTVEISQQ